MSTLLKLDPDLRVELPYGATGATGSYAWSDTYLEGKLVTGSSGALVASIPDATKNSAPRKARITFPGGGDFEILGALIGSTEPPTLTIRLFPTFPGLLGVIDRGDPIVIRGRPHEYPVGSGYWDLQDIGGAGRPVLLSRETVLDLKAKVDAAVVESQTQRGQINTALAQAGTAIATLNAGLSATEQARMLLLSSNSVDLRRYPTNAARNADSPPNLTWGWAADVNNYRRREGTQWVSYDPAPPPADTGAY